MTRDEAINMLYGMKAENLNLADFYTRNKYEALVIAIKALEQEPVIDKIRAGVENHCGLAREDHCRYCSYCTNLMGIRDILELIDKYKVESEGEE